jgi:predicted transcriptional regulator
MKITFNELRDIKHKLPTGSVSRIASELGINEQTVRNYFGANKFEEDGEIVNKHVQPGPGGGIVELERTDILDMARQLIEEANANVTN